jgi:hypothetical protein
MFSKNTEIKFVILPNGDFMVKSHVAGRDSPDDVVKLLGGIFTGKFTESILRTLGDAEIVSVFHEVYGDHQNHIVPSRNPVIRPLHVLHSGDDE